MSHIVRFDCFEVDLDAGQVWKRGAKLKLRDQSFQVLASLLEHSGEVVTREDLRQRLWGDEVFVDFEGNLNIAVARLREALGDSAEHPRFIETLPKRGYRFRAPVHSPVAGPADAVTRRARLLVLPFLNLSGDPSQDYFSDAATDEIITALAGLAPEQLAVIARTTAMHYKGTHKDVAHIARELNVDYALEGGVSRTEDRVAMNVQLIATSDETHIFSRKYDAGMGEVFSLYNSVGHIIASQIPAVADAMRDGRAPSERPWRKPTEDLAAYNEYIQGRYQMWKWTDEGIAKAKQYFEAALARDPDFALACDGLAELYWYLGFLGLAPPREVDRIGRFYALRALEIDSTLPETYALLSYYPKQRLPSDELHYFDWPAMQKDVAHAKALNPASSFVMLRYAIVEMVLGHTEEAAAELERALEFDPLSADLRCWFSTILSLGRQHDRAIEQGLRLVELFPENHLARMVLGVAYLGVHEYEESATAFRTAVRLSGGAPLMLGWLGLSLGLGGHADEARAMLERLHALEGQRYVPPTSFAWTHLGLGEIDEAFRWLNQAVDAPDRMLSPIKTYPFLDPIRSDPRFAVLLRKMNLES